MRVVHEGGNRFGILVLAGVLSLAFTGPAGAAGRDVESELAYIGGLNKLGFPDYAELALEEIRKDFPRDVVDRAELKVLINQGKMDEADALILKRADQESVASWKMRFELAEGHYAWGDAAKFDKIYDQFVAKYSEGTPEHLRQLATDYTYRYYQLLLMMGQQAKAMLAMRTLLKANPEKRSPVNRQVSIELAEMLVSLGEKASKEKRAAYFKEAEELAKRVQWGAKDMWFGRSVVVLANMRMFDDNRAGARNLIKRYLEILTGIHQSLIDYAKESGDESVLRLTPLAQCRFLIGRLHHDEALELLEQARNAEDLGEAALLRKTALEHLVGKRVGGKLSKDAAIYHLYNVFVKYPTTTWAVDAGRRSNEIIEMLEGMGVKIKIEKIDMTDVVNVQFQEARGMYKRNEFNKAAAAYLEVLNLFLEYDASVRALGDLAEIYIELHNDRYVQLVVEYIADRFGAHPKHATDAGKLIGRIAGAYREAENHDRCNAIYEFMFARLPDHPTVPRLMFRRAEDNFREKNYDVSLDYYLRIVEQYPKSGVYFDSLYRIGLCYANRDLHKQTVEAFKTYLAAIENEPPQQGRINAQYRIAEAYRKLDANASASIRFGQLVKLLTGPERAKYEHSPGDRERNEQLLEGAMFNRALSYSKRIRPPKKIPQGRPKTEAYWSRVFKLAGVKYFSEFVTRFPESNLSPTALATAGVLSAMLGKAEAAETAFKRLETEYPESEAARNSLFIYASKLMELGQRKMAIEKFREMIGSSGEFSEKQILKAGQFLFEAEEYEIAEEAFNRVIKSTKNDPIKEVTYMWLSRTYKARKDFPGAIETIEKLFKQSPRTAFTVEASFILGEAYAEMAKASGDNSQYDKSMKAIKMVYKRAETKAEQARADVELARIQVLRNEKNAALASYMRVWLLRSSANPEERPYKEQAFGEAAPLLEEFEMWEDLKQTGDEYLEQYPRGEFVLLARRGISTATAYLGGAAPLPDSVKTDGPDPEPAAVPEGDAASPAPRSDQPQETAKGESTNE